MPKRVISLNQGFPKRSLVREFLHCLFTDLLTLLVMLGTLTLIPPCHAHPTMPRSSHYATLIPLCHTHPTAMLAPLCYALVRWLDGSMARWLDGFTGSSSERCYGLL
jgi:hypothetical protein